MLETRYVNLIPLLTVYTDFDTRHYSYECKATAQERPYTSRPSRTQQLQNPRLMPKLSNDVPTDLQRLSVRCPCWHFLGCSLNANQLGSGAPAEIEPKRAEERGRKRELEREGMTDQYGHSPKRARSLSTSSANSISTISTNRSASASPSPDRVSKRSVHGNGQRTKTNSISPPPKSRKRRYSDASESTSSYSSGARHRSRSREWSNDRNTRRRRRESSPKERGRHRGSGGRSDRRSYSVDKSRIAKERRSMTPPVPQHRSGRGADRDQESGPTHPSQPGRSRHEPRVRPDPPRERSLSPFSKRLALTQAMNLGR